MSRSFGTELARAEIENENQYHLLVCAEESSYRGLG